MKEKLVLALDLGTSFAKIGVVSIQGEVLAMESIPSKIIFTKDNGVEQDPEEWWKIFLEGSRKLLIKDPNLRKNIKGISISTHWSGTVCVDPKGNPIRNAIIWMDIRGASSLKKKIGGTPSVEGYNIFKLWKLIRLTGGAPGFSGKDSISHILFIKEKEPNVFKDTYLFLEPKDYINYKLTGKFFSSYDTISLHWITDNRNLHKIQYHPKLLEMFGLPRNKFPELIKPASIIGKILPEIAKDLGIPKDTLVVSGTPDLQSAAIGSGAVSDFDCHIYIGTSSWISCHLPYKKTDLLHNMATLPSAIPGKYFLANEQEIAGYNFTFLKENLFFPKDYLFTGFPCKEEEIYKRFDELAEKIPPGSNGLIFTPWLSGERTPIEDPYIRGSFLNLSLKTTRAELIRAVLEGVAYNSKWLFYYVEKFLNKKIKRLNFIGGGAKSDLWSQILADVLNVQILQIKNPTSVNLRGAGLLAFVTLGMLQWEQIPNTLQVKKVYEPIQENVKIYNEMFKEFIEIYKKNYKIYKRLNEKLWN
ncbi:MAG: xylulokinase [Leptonema sp. (in: bacteria)]